MEPMCALERLLTVDVAVLDRVALEAVLVDVHVVQSAAEAVRLRALARLEEIDQSSGTVDPAATAAKAARSSRREGERARRRSKAAEKVPELQDALAAGQVSPEHLDSLANALGQLDPDEQAALTARPEEIAAAARSTTADEFARALAKLIEASGDRGRQARFERQRRNTSLRWWTDPLTGMVRLAGEFDPESGLRLTSRLTAVVEALFHDSPPSTCPSNPERKLGHLRALALLHLVLGAHRTAPAAPPAPGHERTDVSATASPDPAERSDAAATDRAGGSRDGSPPTGADSRTPSTRRSASMPPPAIDMVVVVDLDTLRSGLHAGGHIDLGMDIELPAETLRRMACTANIIPAVLDGNGVLLDLGRRQRLASPEQRRALHTMYRTCAVDAACQVPFHQCEPHHIEFWTRDHGPTDLDNLVPACSRHHHAVHEGGWRLELRATDRRLTVTYPDGSIQYVWPDSAPSRPHTREAA